MDSLKRLEQLTTNTPISKADRDVFDAVIAERDALRQQVATCVGHDVAADPTKWSHNAQIDYLLARVEDAQAELAAMQRRAEAAESDWQVAERQVAALTAALEKQGLSFEALRKANVERCETASYHIKAWKPWEWSNAMAGECGEACNVTKKMNRIWPANEFIKNWNTPEDQRIEDLAERLSDEIADVVIYADLLAASIARSLAECVVRKFNAKSDEIGSPVKLAELAAARGAS